MLKKHDNRAFTIAELIITTVIMAVVMIIAPVVILKKSVKPRQNPNLESYIAKCEEGKCIYDAKLATFKTKKGTEERYDYNKNTDELYKIELIGGGGGGSDTSSGYGGEVKIIDLFSLQNNKINNTGANEDYGILTGYYLMEIGEGGQKGKSGSPTTICAISEVDSLRSVDTISCESNGKIIAKVNGGRTSNELSNNRPAGNGGKIGESGSRGSVTIK